MSNTEELFSRVLREVRTGFSNVSGKGDEAIIDFFCKIKRKIKKLRKFSRGKTNAQLAELIGCPETFLVNVNIKKEKGEYKEMGDLTAAKEGYLAAKGNQDKLESWKKDFGQVLVDALNDGKGFWVLRKEVGCSAELLAHTILNVDQDCEKLFPKSVKNLLLRCSKKKAFEKKETNQINPEEGEEQILVRLRDTYAQAKKKGYKFVRVWSAENQESFFKLLTTSSKTVQDMSKFIGCSAGVFKKAINRKEKEEPPVVQKKAATPEPREVLSKVTGPEIISAIVGLAQKGSADTAEIVRLQEKVTQLQKENEEIKRKESNLVKDLKKAQADLVLAKQENVDLSIKLEQVNQELQKYQTPEKALKDAFAPNPSASGIVAPATSIDKTRSSLIGSGVLAVSGDYSLNEGHEMSRY